MHLFNKMFLLAASALATFAASADAANRLLAFSTPGTDRYADGSAVLDGEWYALVWSADGVFEGLSVTCEPTDPKDAFVLAAPLAKEGRCPFSVFQIDSQSENCHSNGVYAVLLFDTRSADKTTVSPRGKERLPVRINGIRPIQSYSVTLLKTGVLANGTSVSSPSWSASSVDTLAPDYRPPQIVSFAVNAGRAEMEVVGLKPAVKYNVQMGATPTTLSTYALETPQTDVQTARFSIDPGEARFFRVVREPLVRGGEEKK